MTSNYQEIYNSWLDDFEDFWEEAADAIHWYKKWDKVLDDSRALFSRWFSGGLLNTCYNTLDLHCENGRADQIALIYDSPVTQTIKTFTYRELLNEVSRFAGVLRSRDVEKGDRVIIYMPMVPETLVAMLACARIGAIHSVVFGGFSSPELAKRIDDAQPRLVVSASCGIEVNRVVPYKPLLDKEIETASWKPKSCIILQREQEHAPMIADRDLDWHELMTGAEAVDCVPVLATDPLYILYTSGTTGVPKGVVRDNGGHLVALKWSLPNIYNSHAGEVFWASSDLGWPIGHSYILYGPLANGNTTILYEGKPVGTPDAGAFWRVISQHKVETLFVAPTAIRAIKREDPRGERIKGQNLEPFRTLFVAGERCDPDTLEWATKHLRVPVIDRWWQTETGWPVGANMAGPNMLPIKPGSCGVPMPGYFVRVVDDEGEEVSANTTANVVIKLPLPPGCLLTLWNNDDGCQESYFNSYPGYYKTGDAGFRDDDGYIWIMGRTDDIINVAGHRLSTVGMEEVIAAHPDVAECAVIGKADAVKGEVPLGLVVLKAGADRSEAEIVSEVIAMVRERIGPVASFKQARVVNLLPKTRSGKIVRGTIKKIADGVDYQIPATIEDETVLDEIKAALT